MLSTGNVRPYTNAQWYTSLQDTRVPFLPVCLEHPDFSKLNMNDASMRSHGDHVTQSLLCCSPHSAAVAENTELLSALEKARREVRVSELGCSSPPPSPPTLLTPSPSHSLTPHTPTPPLPHFSNPQHLRGQLSILQMTSSEIREERARRQLRERKRAEQ